MAAEETTAARPVEPITDGADAAAAPAAVTAGVTVASASDPPVRRASGDGVARGGDAPSQEQSPRRGRDEDDSLAKRLAGSGDQADRVVCKYIVDCFDDAVHKVVAHFDRRLSRLTGEKDPAALARGIEKELEAGREALRREVTSARARVVDDVRETLGPEYRLGADSSSVHAPVPRVESAAGAVDRARAEFRQDVDSARRDTVQAVHGALGGQARFASGRQGVVPPVPDASTPGMPDAAGAVAVRDARAEFVGSPRAIAVGHITQASLMVAAARGPESLARMGDLIEKSPLRQAGLETVGCDPVLVKLCADVRDCGREPSRASALRTLATDLGNRHLARCREEPEAADRDEAAFAGGRAALRSGACASLAAEVERGFAPACRVEIDVRVGRVPSRVPAERDLAGQALSLEGRAWLERLRERVVVPEASGPDRAVVAGAPRGPVRSLLGRRAQGFERVVQLARTRRGPVAAAVSSRLLRWGTSGGARRLKAVGLVLGSSKHLMAGLVRAGVDPVAVAAASSPGAARAIATGASRPLADGARAADHRRLVQVAEELDRRQTGAELTSGGSGSARTARLEHRADVLAGVRRARPRRSGARQPGRLRDVARGRGGSWRGASGRRAVLVWRQRAFRGRALWLGPVVAFRAAVEGAWSSDVEEFPAPERVWRFRRYGMDLGVRLGRALGVVRPWIDVGAVIGSGSHFPARPALVAATEPAFDAGYPAVDELLEVLARRSAGVAGAVGAGVDVGRRYRLRFAVRRSWPLLGPRFGSPYLVGAGFAWEVGPVIRF